MAVTVVCVNLIRVCMLPPMCTRRACFSVTKLVTLWHMGIADIEGSWLTLSWACVILPTFSVLGAPEPLGTPAALANRTDAGGVFSINVKLLSCMGI